MSGSQTDDEVADTLVSLLPTLDMTPPLTLSKSTLKRSRPLAIAVARPPSVPAASSLPCIFPENDDDISAMLANNVVNDGGDAPTNKRRRVDGMSSHNDHIDDTQPTTPKDAYMTARDAACSDTELESASSGSAKGSSCHVAAIMYSYPAIGSQMDCAPSGDTPRSLVTPSMPASSTHEPTVEEIDKSMPMFVDPRDPPRVPLNSAIVHLVPIDIKLARKAIYLVPDQ